MWISRALVGVTRALVGATGRYVGTEPITRQAIYFANHTSHLDTLALWSALPPDQRTKARPVAARDYWGSTPLRRYVALNGLNAVLIDRARENPESDPLQPLMSALELGDSLIIFPEGTRHAGAIPGPFKSGIYRLAMAFPDVALVPVYLQNLHRSMPKGSLVPVPMICTVRIGAPLPRVAGETKDEFLGRARQAVIDLS